MKFRYYLINIQTEHHAESPRVLINCRKYPISCFNERNELVCSSTEWQNFIIKWSSDMLMQVLQVCNYVENQVMNETAGFMYDKSYIGFCQYTAYRYDRC